MSLFDFLLETLQIADNAARARYLQQYANKQAWQAYEEHVARLRREAEGVVDGTFVDITDQKALPAHRPEIQRSV